MVYQPDLILNQGFVFWLARPCRQGYKTVVVAQVFHQTVYFRLVAVAFNYGGLQVIRYDYFGDTLEKSKHTGDGINKVLAFL